MNQMLDKVNQENIDEISRQLCQTDLKYLCRNVLKFKDWDVCHDELHSFLKNSKKNKKLILMPRGHLKTSTITIARGIQHILCDFDTSILYASAVGANAESFLKEAKDHLQNPRLSYLFGDFTSKKWNENLIEIPQRTRPNKSATIDTAGADKAVTSQHYDVIFLDDIVNRQTINTLDQKQKTRKFRSDIMNLLNPGGTLYVLGTRWDYDDEYQFIIDNLKDDYDIHIQSVTRDSSMDGEFIFPKKFNSRVLLELLKDIGSYELSCQYFNDPSSPTTRIFNPPVRYWTVEKSMTAGNVVQFDPATSEKRLSCDAVVSCTAINEANQICVMGYTVFKGDTKIPGRMIDEIFSYLQRFKSKNLIIETNGGQEVYVHLIKDEAKKRGVTVNIIEVHQSKSKESRILALQPYWERGDLLLKPGMIELEGQLDRFRVPIASAVDILDSIAMRIQDEVKMSFKFGINSNRNGAISEHPRFTDPNWQEAV